MHLWYQFDTAPLCRSGQCSGQARIGDNAEMFGRRKRTSSAPSGSWTVATGSAEGQPIVVRYDSSYGADAARKGGLPFRIGVALPFDDLLRPNDHDALARFEDAMATALEARGARLVLVITQPTFREFVLYAPSADWASDAHDELRRKFPKYSVQMQAADDPSWSAYSALTSS